MAVPVGEGGAGRVLHTLVPDLYGERAGHAVGDERPGAGYGGPHGAVDVVAHSLGMPAQSRRPGERLLRHNGGEAGKQRTGLGHTGVVARAEQHRNAQLARVCRVDGKLARFFSVQLIILERGGTEGVGQHGPGGVFPRMIADEQHGGIAFVHACKTASVPAAQQDAAAWVQQVVLQVYACAVRVPDDDLLRACVEQSTGRCVRLPRGLQAGEPVVFSAAQALSRFAHHTGGAFAVYRDIKFHGGTPFSFT